MGHKGPAVRPRCIGPGRAWTQILFYSILLCWTVSKCPEEVVISGLAYRSKDDGAYLLDKLHPFLEPSSASSTSPSTSRGGETADSFADVVPCGREAQRAVSATVRACDMKLFLVAYVSGFIAKRLLNDSNCDGCKKMSDIWSSITTWYLHRIHGAQQ
jgi:hypothetical protein